MSAAGWDSGFHGNCERGPHHAASALLQCNNCDIQYLDEERASPVSKEYGPRAFKPIGTYIPACDI